MITNDTVKHIAALSRLHIEDARLPVFRRELQDILQYVDKLGRLDVSHVSPMTHVLKMGNVFRDDLPAPSLSREEVLSLAPESHDGHYKVPRVIE